MTESEWGILFMTDRNDITSFNLPFILNEIIKTNLFLLILFLIPFCPIPSRSIVFHPVLFPSIPFHCVPSRSLPFHPVHLLSNSNFFYAQLHQFFIIFSLSLPSLGSGHWMFWLFSFIFSNFNTELKGLQEH